jgi:hypothetical protein
MEVTSDYSPDGLTEGVGQTLGPVGIQNSPLKVQDGQWSFRFNYADPSKIAVFVTVSFGPPFSLTADLSSEMNPAQVESLIAWLGRVQTAMKNPPETQN